MKKVAFLIPGFFDTTELLGYQEITKKLKSEGFEVVNANITWKFKTISDYIAEFIKIYTESKGNYNLVLGFSFGAMIAYLSAEQLNPDKLYLCSLSPYFKEDFNDPKANYEKYIGKKRLKDFKNYSFDEYIKRLHCEITLFLGDSEIPEVVSRVELARSKLKGAKFIGIKNVDHDISKNNYFEAINNEIGAILVESK